MQTTNDLDLGIEAVLRSLRIDGTYKGYRYLVYGIRLVVQDPRRTELITKDVYPDIARTFKSTVFRVERNIRFAIASCWPYSNEALDQMAGYHLAKRPTNRQFIDIVAFFVRSH